MNTITNEQALQNLYAASRIAPLTAEQHDVLRKSAEQLLEVIKPAPAIADKVE